MEPWTSDELDRIGNADELQISSLKPDGRLHKPVTIWVVRVGDDLFVRSYLGRAGAWYRNTQVARAGQIQAGGVTKDVHFVDETGAAINAQIDAAYRSKYKQHAAEYVDPMVVLPARAATIKLVPRAAAR